MTASLPLFDHSELDSVRAERETLLKLLRKGGVDAHSRIRREHKVALLTAKQLQLEKLLEVRP